MLLEIVPRAVVIMLAYKHILFTILATVVNAKHVARHIPNYHEAAATKTQIKFAEENNYDQTGPGAQMPEGAYKTYKSLEEVLIGYLDDPDTKLPESERQKAYYHYNLNSFRPSIQLEATDVKEPEEELIKKIHYNLPQSIYENNNYFIRPITYNNYADSGPLDYSTFLKLNKVGTAKENIYTSRRQPYNTERDIIVQAPNKKILEQVSNIRRRPIKTKDPIEDLTKSKYEGKIPQYTYSYGVHDRMTGDSKTVHETRDGDTVRGFYTVMDADGKQRTVTYSADDKHGFKATVERTPTNNGPS